MVIQLTKDEISEVKSILAKHIQHCEVWVFGSRARGEAKQYSDLDLLLKNSSAISLKTLGDLTEDFEKSSLSFKVELVDWNRITEEFQQHIQTHWQYLG